MLIEPAEMKVERQREIEHIKCHRKKRAHCVQTF